MKPWLAALLFANTLLGQPRNLRLPDEAAGVDAIAQALVSVFDQADIVALGEEHEWKPDSDLRIALVRHPDFSKKVHSIVVEFGRNSHQELYPRRERAQTRTGTGLEDHTSGQRRLSHLPRLLRGGTRRQYEAACRRSHSRFRS